MVVTMRSLGIQQLFTCFARQQRIILVDMHLNQCVFHYTALVKALKHMEKFQCE